MAKTGIFIFGCAVILAVAVYFKVFASTVTASWSYDYTQTPSCTSARSSDCIDHFEILDITRQDTPRAIQSVKNPLSAAGKVDGISANFKYGPPFGEVTFSVIAVERQKNGDLISSNPFAARATASIRPGAKASLLF